METRLLLLPAAVSRRPVCRMIRCDVRLAVLNCVGALTLLPQFIPDLPCQWGQSIDLQALPEYRLSPAEGRAFGRKIEALAAILRDAKVFNPPLGFQPRLHGRFWSPQECRAGARQCNDRPVQAQFMLFLHYFVEVKGKPAWGGEANTSVETDL